MKKLDGSITVEASFIVPFITFVLIAFLHIIFYAHDSAILQTYALQTAQEALSESFQARYSKTSKGKEQVLAEKRKKAGSALIMMKGSRLKVSGSSSFKNIFHSLHSYRSLGTTASGNMKIRIPGAAAFTGESLSSSQKMETIRIDYADDWFRQHFKKELKGEGNR